MEALQDVLAKVNAEQPASLNLFGKNIGPEGAHLLANELRTNTCLSELYVHGNELGDTGAEAIAGAFSSRLSNPEENELNENDSFAGRSTVFGSSVMGSVDKSVPAVNTTICRLDLSGNNISHVGAEALAEMLAESNALRVLVLNGNNIGEMGVTAIAKTLRTNTSLTDLDLTLNSIGSNGARAMGWALQFNSCALAKLTLDANEIGEDGAKSFAESCLRRNTRLHSVCLRHNGIGTDGANFIAGALKDNTHVTTLDLVSAYDKQDIDDSALATIDAYLLRNLKAAAIVRSAATRAESSCRVPADLKAAVRTGRVHEILRITNDRLAMMGVTNQTTSQAFY